MSERLQEVLLRKQHLLARSSELRTRLLDHAEGIAPLLALADRLYGAAAALRRHPEWVAGAVVFLLVARPRFVWRWAKRALVGWRMWRSLQSLLAGAAARSRGI